MSTGENKSSKIKGRTLLILLVVSFLYACGPSIWNSFLNSPMIQYQQGIKSLKERKYSDAKEHFESCLYHKDAKLLYYYSSVRGHNTSLYLRSQDPFFKYYPSHYPASNPYKGPFAEEIKRYYDSMQPVNQKAIERYRQSPEGIQEAKNKELKAAAEAEKKAKEEARQQALIDSIPYNAPYVGMSEKYIDSTAWGRSRLEKSETKYGPFNKSYAFREYRWYDYYGKMFGYADVKDGIITSVSEYTNSPTYKGVKEKSSSNASNKKSRSFDSTDEDIFWDDYGDDFDDFDEAEQYFYDHY